MRIMCTPLYFKIDEMEDFLPLLHRTERQTIRQRGKQEPGVDIFFKIAFNESGESYITVVDKKGNVVEPDYRNYTGEVFNALRTLQNIQENNDRQISWGGEASLLFLKEYPYLIYQLLRCKNLVDEKLSPIKTCEETAEVQLLLEEQNGTISASFLLKTTTGVEKDFQMINDSFALAEGTIYPVHSLCDNYDQLRYFYTSFSTSMLENYLSVLYSFLENIGIANNEYELVRSDISVPTISTIVFDKVDDDHSLYLRVVQSAMGVDFDFMNQFDLIYVAHVTVDKQIVLQRIDYLSGGGAGDKFRELLKKSALSAQDRKEIYEDDGFFIIPECVANPFLVNALPVLVRDFQLVGAEKLTGYKLRPVKPSLQVSIQSGIDFLEGSAQLSLDDEKFSLGDFLQQYRKQKYITLSDGNRAIIDDAYVRKLERIFQKGTQKESVKVSFFDLPEMENLLQAKVEGTSFQHCMEVYRGFNDLGKKKMSFKKVNAKLRPYQEEGVKWIDYLYENNLGGCLADDMGLGKTLQTIAMLVHIYPKETVPSLIVMPKSLLFNWTNELRKFAPQITFYTYYSTNRSMEEALQSNVILTTYAMVRNDVEIFKEQNFHYVILDESQNIKNVTAQTTQAVMLLNAPHRLALSGTPIENNLTELYSLFRFLNPAMFGSLENFNQKYTYPIQRKGEKEPMEALRRKIFPFLLRRLKRDVLKDLPERIDQTLYAEMDANQASLYERKRAMFAESVKRQIAAEGIEKSQFIMFQALNELRRLASVPESLTDNRVSSPKIPVLMESLIDAVSNGHKVVVFFNYVAGIELVGEQLELAGIDFVTMTGSTHDRQSVVERFQNDQRCKVMLMTLKTGGVGLNLTAADTVFIFEPWWNKAAEEQAINRLHRIGQKCNVLSFSIITKNTIEEKICQLQQQKAELLAGLIGSDEGSTKNLTEEDIKFILEW